MFKKKVPWIILGFLTVAAVVLASCNTTPTTTTQPTTKVTSTTQPSPPPSSTFNFAPATTSPPTTTAAPTKTATGSQPQYGGVFNIAAGADFPHADPYYYENTVNSYIDEELAHGDWARSGSGNGEHLWVGVYYPSQYCTGMLAQSWEEPDNQTLIFHLRQGVRWQNRPPVNGREFVASDVVYSFGRWYGIPGTGFDKPSTYFTDAQYLLTTSITATDKYTVVFKHKPSVQYLNEFLGPGVGDQSVPREAVEQAVGYDIFSRLVGTGPWMITDHVQDSSFTFIKNPDYWGRDELHPQNQLPYMDTLRLLIVPDTSTQLAAFRTGKTCVMGMDWRTALQLAKTNPTIMEVPYSQYSATVALRYGVKPFDDIRVRQALQMSVNLDELAASFYGGVSKGPPLPLLGVPGFFTPFDQLPQDVKDSYAYNPTKAKQLLADAGYPNGFQTKIFVSTVTSTTTGAGTDLALVMQNYFAAVGVKMDIVTMESTAWLGKAYAFDMDPMCFSSGAQVAVPLGVLGWYSSNPKRYWNYAQIADPKFEDLLTQAGNATDLAKWQSLLKQANDYSFAQHWHVNLIPVTTYFCYQSWLGGYKGDMSLGAWRGADVWSRIWIDQAKKTALGQ